VATRPAGADETRAQQAQALCDQVVDATPRERRDLLRRGIALAEQAVAENDLDADAHYALFCNLGRQIELSRVSPASVMTLRRVWREIERAIELRPNWPDALMGKGSLLIHTPRPLGGDPTEGERLLRRALELDPDHIEAHLQLAECLKARGEKREARAVARRALALAEARAELPSAAQARRLLATIGE
jgi:tetratricopeptide (TPR) repeat protein